MKIEEITTKETKKGDKFYKVIADGKTYNAFMGEPAFELLEANTFSVGSLVKLKFDVSKDGKYKNLVDIERSEEAPPVPEASKNTPTPPLQVQVDPDVWVNKDRRIAREASVKAASRLVSATIVADAKPDIEQFTKDVIKAAKEFEKYVYEGMESIPGKDIDVLEEE